MSFEMILALSLSACFVALAWWQWRGATSPARRAKEGQRFATRNLAYVAPAFVPQFDERWASRTKFGAGLLLVLALCAPFTVPRSGQGAWTIIPLLIVSLFGNVVFLSRLMVEFSRPLTLPAASAVARMREVSVRDYVSPARRVMSLVAVTAIVSLLGVLGWARQAGRWTAPGLAWWGLMGALVALLVLALLVPVAAGRIVSGPEPADDAATLYWQDAWRSESLTAVYKFGLLGLFVSCLAASGGLSSTNEGGPSFTGLSWGIALVGYVMLLIDLGLMSRDHAKPSQLWFRRRLWPDLAPGEVLMPASAEVSR